MFEILSEYYQKYIDATLSTLQLSFFALVIGLVLGVVICMAKISKIKILEILATIYVEVLRNTPLLVQILIIYFALPEFGIKFSAFVSAIIALSFNSGAYISEILRAGINAIDNGQVEAGRSLGLSYWQTMKLIVLPHAFKNSLPALGNEFISLVKESAIVSFIGVSEIMFVAGTVKNATYEPFIPYFIAAVIYFVITSVLSYAVKALEKKYAN